MTTQSVRLKVAQSLKALPSDRVKELVLQWVSDTETDLQEFQQHVAVAQSEMAFSKVNADVSFQTLAESERLEQRLTAIDDYQPTEQAVPHDAMIRWAEKLALK